MDKPVLIGLTGKAGHGKNTVGEFIKDWAQENGQKAQLQGFADRLKLSFARIFVPDATLEEALEFSDAIKTLGSIKHDTILPNGLFHRFGVRNSITGREALQHYGTESHRDVFGDNFWVDQLLPVGGEDDKWNTEWIYKWDVDTDFAVITDLRFPNEADRVLEVGGKIYEVRRNGLESNVPAHASEQKLDDGLMYGFFDNNGTLEELRASVFKEMDDLTADTEYDEFVISQLGERVARGL